MNKMDSETINRLTHKIIGCAMEVHNQLGNGFQEVVYQRSLAIEFQLQGISFARELGEAQSADKSAATSWP